MTEQTIEHYLVSRVKETDGWALKLTSAGTNGIPDRLLLFPGGYAVFAETKAPGKKPRALQTAVHRKLKKLGFNVYPCIDSKEKVNRIIHDYQEEVPNGVEEIL